MSGRVEDQHSRGFWNRHRWLLLETPWPPLTSRGFQCGVELGTLPAQIKPYFCYWTRREGNGNWIWRSWQSAIKYRIYFLNHGSASNWPLKIQREVDCVRIFYRSILTLSIFPPPTNFFSWAFIKFLMHFNLSLVGHPSRIHKYSGVNVADSEILACFSLKANGQIFLTEPLL